jgi:formate hydrogenlyase regulatory protein HycA
VPVPETIRIVPDQLRFGTAYHVEHAGRLVDGRQFLAFVLGGRPESFVPGASPESKQLRWLAVLHLFNAAGRHQETRTWSGGLEDYGSTDAVKRTEAKLQEWLTELKHYTIAPIAIQPFDVTIDDIRFGLIPSFYGEDAAELLPNGLAFVPPWDGTYDT